MHSVRNAKNIRSKIRHFLFQILKIAEISFNFFF
jgi:hypothetical protein